MIGNNKIVLNQATMQEAIQFWLDSQTTFQFAEVGYITASSGNENFTINLAAKVTA